MNDNATPTPPNDPKSPRGVSYEHKDLSALGIAKTIIGLLVMIVGVYVVCALLAKLLNVRSIPSAGGLASVHSLPPEPRLEVEGPAGLRELRASEDLLLNNYAWVEASQGVVRIPIDRAMELVVQRGLPSRAEKSNS